MLDHPLGHHLAGQRRPAGDHRHHQQPQRHHHHPQQPPARIQHHHHQRRRHGQAAGQPAGKAPVGQGPPHPSRRQPKTDHPGHGHSQAPPQANRHQRHQHRPGHRNNGATGQPPLGHRHPTRRLPLAGHHPNHHHPSNHQHHPSLDRQQPTRHHPKQMKFGSAEDASHGWLGAFDDPRQEGRAAQELACIARVGEWPTGQQAVPVRGEETDAMVRATAVLGEGGWGAQARRLARALSPVAVSPAAPRETVAALDAWGPSLMPRSARGRGVAMGAWDPGGAGDQRRGRAADQVAGAGRRAPARAAGGLGGGRGCRGGAGGGAGAALPQAVGGVAAVHRSAAAGRRRRRGRP